MRFHKLTATAVSVVIAFSAVMPALAMETEAGVLSSVKPQRVVDGACMSSAVDKRDAAIIAAFETFSASMKSALTKRKDGLKAAWALTDASARKTALRNSWQMFTKSHKDARDTHRKTRQAAWKQFKTDSKTCKGNTSEEGNVEATAEISF